MLLEEVPSAMQSMGLDAISETEASSTDEAEFISETEIIDKLEHVAYDVDNPDEYFGVDNPFGTTDYFKGKHPLSISPVTSPANTETWESAKNTRRGIPVYLRDYSSFKAEPEDNNLNTSALMKSPKKSEKGKAREAPCECRSGSEDEGEEEEGEEREKKTSYSHSSWWSWGSDNASDSDTNTNNLIQKNSTGYRKGSGRSSFCSFPSQSSEHTNSKSKKSPRIGTTAEKFSKPETHNKIELIQSQVIPILDMFVDSIISADSSLPFLVRSICSETCKLMLETFPKTTEEEILKIVGCMIYFKFLDPILVNPISLGIHYPSGAREQKKLIKISKILKGSVFFLCRRN